MKLHCVRQLNKDSWEYRVKRSGDEPNCDDAVLLVDELDEREELKARIQTLARDNHEAQWRYMVGEIGRATDVAYDSPADAVEGVRQLMKFAKDSKAALARADALLDRIGINCGICAVCGRVVQTVGHRETCDLAAYLRDREGGAV